MGLLQRLLDGEWPNSEFLVVRPGQRVFATNDNQVIGAGLPPAATPSAT